MIYEGSRYENADLLPVRDKRGEPTKAIYAMAEHSVRFNYDLYITTLGDRFDLLADRFYGDAEQWWRIAEVNPHIYDPAVALEPGTALRIPRDPVIRR